MAYSLNPSSLIAT